MSEKKTDLCAASDRRAEEIARLRARAEEAEAELDAVIVLMAIDEERRQKAGHHELEDKERQHAETIAQRDAAIARALAADATARAEKAEADADEWYMLFQAEEDRAEKAEAERDELKRLHRHALDSVDQVFQSCDEVPHPLLPDFCRIGEDKFRAVIRLANSYISERARAEKYLKAMTRLVETAHTNAEWLEPMAAIHAIVEEARRAE